MELSRVAPRLVLKLMYQLESYERRNGLIL